MFKVKAISKATGSTTWLRGTVFTFDDDASRATSHATREAAEAAFKNAMRFNKPRVFAQRFSTEIVVA